MTQIPGDSETEQTLNEETRQQDDLDQVDQLKREIRDKTDQIEHLELSLEQNEMELRSRTNELCEIETRLGQSLDCIEQLQLKIESTSEPAPVNNEVSVLLEDTLQKVLELNHELSAYKTELVTTKEQLAHSQETIQQLQANASKVVAPATPPLPPLVMVKPDQSLSPEILSDPSLMAQALRNAQGQISRLQEARRSQQEKFQQLQVRQEEMNSELNQSVDALRRAKHECQSLKQKHSNELCQMRTNFARSSAAATNSQNQRRAVSSSPQLELSAMQIECENLREELHQQKRASEREQALLKAQLTELTDDSRMLRVQLAKLNHGQVNGTGQEAAPAACSQCAKLQTLCEVLQSKQQPQKADSEALGLVQDRLAELVQEQNIEQALTRVADLVKTQNEVLRSLQNLTGLHDESDSLVLVKCVLETRTAASSETGPGAAVVQGLFAQLKQERAQFEQQKTRWQHNQLQQRQQAQQSQSASEEEAKLRQQLVSAQTELLAAEDQVRACNLEFLDLRECVSHANRERDLYQEQLVGLQDQGRNTERVMQQQMQELVSARQLAEHYRRAWSDLSGSNARAGGASVIDLSAAPGTASTTPSFSLQMPNFAAASNGFREKAVIYAKNACKRLRNNDWSGQMRQCQRVLVSTSSWRNVRSMPRSKMILFLLIYVAMLHLLIIRMMLDSGEPSSLPSVRPELESL